METQSTVFVALHLSVQARMEAPATTLAVFVVLRLAQQPLGSSARYPTTHAVREVRVQMLMDPSSTPSIANVEQLLVLLSVAGTATLRPTFVQDLFATT